MENEVHEPTDLLLRRSRSFEADLGIIVAAGSSLPLHRTGVLDGQNSLGLFRAKFQSRMVRPVRVTQHFSCQYDQISARAFSELAVFVRLTRHLLAPGGRWLAMKGLRPDNEVGALPADIAVEAIVPLTVPGLDAERHLIILKAGS